MTIKIALHLSPLADTKTRQRFFEAVEKINHALAHWMERKAGGVGTIEEWDERSSVVYIMANEAEHDSIDCCKAIARLFMERHGVGDKYKIVLEPHDL